MRNMTIKYRSLTCLMCFSCLAGCASTQMTSQANPELIGRQYHKVMVEADFHSLEHRHKAEDFICKEIVDLTLSECEQSYKLFFPGEPHTKKEIDGKLHNLNIDGVLVIRQTNSGVITTHVGSTSIANASASVFGDSVYGTGITQSFDSYVEKPWANYDAIFSSSVDDRVAWYATSTSNGAAGDSWDDLIEYMGSKTVKHLIADKILKKSNRDPWPD